MAAPAHLRCVLYVAFAALVSAETPPVTAPVAAPPAETPVSPKLDKLFGGEVPKFAPPKTDVPASLFTEPPRNGIIRLPTYIVREPRPISPGDVMTPQAREDAIVKRYVGEPTGLDVALNKYTLNTLWKKIPLLGSISDFGATNDASRNMGYKERIATDYSRIEAKRRYLEALGVSADVPPTKPAPDKEKKPSPSDDK